MDLIYCFCLLLGHAMAYVGAKSDNRIDEQTSSKKSEYAVGYFVLACNYLSGTKLFPGNVTKNIGSILLGVVCGNVIKTNYILNCTISY